MMKFKNSSALTINLDADGNAFYLLGTARSLSDNSTWMKMQSPRKCSLVTI